MRKATMTDVKDIKLTNPAYECALQGYDIAYENMIEAINDIEDMLGKKEKEYLLNEMQIYREAFIENLKKEEKG
jgi:hypothetical protein